jgi:hypothetical protein
MGRVTLGATYLSFKDALISYCWREIQTSTTPFGTGLSPTDLSLCAYLDYDIKPYVVGSVNAGASNTNFSIGTYVRSQGYGYFFSLINTTNNTIRVDNPASTPAYGSPGYSQTTSASWPGSGATGVINVLNIVQSNTAAYIRVRSTPSPGYEFTAWYTAPSGGSVITTSTDYNAYYNYSSVINNSTWYARNAASQDYWSTSVGVGIDATVACYSPGGGATIWMEGTTGNFQTQAGPVYINDSGTFYPTTYIHQAAKVRYWNNSTKVFNPAAFCPGV